MARRVVVTSCEECPLLSWSEAGPFWCRGRVDAKGLPVELQRIDGIPDRCPAIAGVLILASLDTPAPEVAR